jgi:uncharacterized membrane protein YgdD (TMEM256/DUF423 family)
VNRNPIAQTVVFAALAIVGIALAVLATDLVAASHVAAVTAIGAAMFAGSLAFFLSEMFRWSRARIGG